MTAGLITEIVLGGVLLASLTYFVTKATVKRKIISKIDFMSEKHKLLVGISSDEKVYFTACKQNLTVQP